MTVLVTFGRFHLLNTFGYILNSDPLLVQIYEHFVHVFRPVGAIIKGFHFLRYWSLGQFGDISVTVFIHHRVVKVKCEEEGVLTCPTITTPAILVPLLEMRSRTVVAIVIVALPTLI